MNDKSVLSKDFPVQSGGAVLGCVEDELKAIDSLNQYVPTPTKKTKCPVEVESWFSPNQRTKSVPVQIMVTQISENPPYYKFSETGTPGFAPLNCEKKAGWGCTSNSGFSTDLCYENSWDNPKCFNGYYAMSFHSWIYYNSLTTLLVKSDDDSWTFINGKLASDIGGTHGDSVNPVNTKLSTLADKLGLTKQDTFYTFDMYYAERGANIAGLTFIISPPPMCSEHPEIKGCCDDKLDSDKDGLPDCLDGCPLDANRFGPGTCECGAPADCNETKHCGLYTKNTCTKTPWSSANCGLCGDTCVKKSELSSCPCSSFDNKDDCNNSGRCTFCEVGQTCSDKNKCLCSNASKDQCSTSAQTLNGGKCNYCYNSVCQDSQCLDCADITNKDYCNSDDRCNWCSNSDGYKEGCAAKNSCVADCSLAYYETHIDDCSARKCFNCGNNVCATSSAKCPACSSYNNDATKCDASANCSFCESMHKCLPKTDICYTCGMLEETDCTTKDSDMNCIWCDKVGSCYRNDKNKSAEEICPVCETLTKGECNGNCQWCSIGICLHQDDISTKCKCEEHIDKCNKLNCHKCGPNKCIDINTACPECIKIDVNQHKCSEYFNTTTSENSVCSDCGTSCANKVEACPACDSYETSDSCLASPHGCVWCGNACADNYSSCPACSTYDSKKGNGVCTQALILNKEVNEGEEGEEATKYCTKCAYRENPNDDDCVANESECDLECNTIKDANECNRNCIWCGEAEKCRFKRDGCPACSTYVQDSESEETVAAFQKRCSGSFEFVDGNLSKCQFCDEVNENDSSDSHCKSATLPCFVNCAKITSEMTCQSHLECTWCGAGLCTFSKGVDSGYSECPECSTYTSESECHDSVRSCSWCDNACHTRDECVSRAITTITTIGAGVIAAIAVGAAVFAGLSVLGSKKVYDAIVLARESSMESAASNPMYEQKDNGGDNPLFNEAA